MDKEGKLFGTSKVSDGITYTWRKGEEWNEEVYYPDGCIVIFDEWPDSDCPANRWDSYPANSIVIEEEE